MFWLVFGVLLWLLMVSTIFESAAFLCTESADGQVTGNWMDTNDTRNVPFDTVRIDDEVTSTFNMNGLAVEWT